MRMRTPVLAAILTAVSAFGITATRVPKAVTIVSACTPSGSPDVQPQRRDMERADHVEWREPSGRAASWMITPKNPADWPFADTIRGTQDSPAATAIPAPSAPAGHPFAYDVTVYCADGSVQRIDPEIVIGN